MHKSYLLLILLLGLCLHLQASDTLFVFKKAGKCGYVNLANEQVIDPIYECTYFNMIVDVDSTEFLPLQKEGLWGILDTRGKQLLPFKYEQRMNGLDAYVKFEQDGKFGFTDISGNFVLEAIYDDLGFANKQGLVSAKKDSLWGVINVQGEVLEPFNSPKRIFYQDPNFGNMSPDIRFIRKAGKLGAVTTEGDTIIACQYDALSNLKVTDIFGNTQQPAKRFIRAKQGQYFGLYNEQGENIVPAVYDRILEFAGKYFLIRGNTYSFLNEQNLVEELPYEGVAVALSPLKMPYTNKSLVMVTKAGKYGFFDAANMRLIDPVYDQVRPFKEGFAPVRKGEVWGFIDSTGRQVIAPKYQRVKKFSEGKAGVQLNGKWGFIDTDGKIVVPIQYLEVGEYKHGLAGVNTAKGQWEKTDKVQLVVLSDSLFYKKRYNDQTQISSYQKDRWTYIDERGQRIIEGQFWKVNDFKKEGWASVENWFVDSTATGTRSGNRTGIIDRNGVLLLPVISDGPVQYNGETFIVEQGDKRGLMNASQKWLIEPKFQRLQFTTNDKLLLVKTDTGFGFVDTAGKEIVPAIFDEIKPAFLSDRTYTPGQPFPSPQLYVLKKGEEKILYHLDHGPITPLCKVLIPKRSGQVYFEIADDGGFYLPDGSFLGIEQPAGVDLFRGR